MKARQVGLIHSASLISSLTLLSRVLGFLRDMAIAYALGAGYKADVFFVAFRIPNLFRRLYAEGSLSLPYMPEMGKSYALGDDVKLSGLANNLGGFAAFFYLGLTLLGVVAAPLFVSLLAPGFVGSGAKWHLTVKLTRWLFPYVFCIGVAGFVMARLNTHEHFAAPAAAPSLLNLSMLALLGLGGHFKLAPEWSLTWGVLLGGFLQVAFQFHWARPLVLRWSLVRWWRSPEVSAVLRLLVPTMLGAAVYHLNIFIATLFASFLSVGSISFLYYAERLVQFPLGLFGGAISTSVLPRFTRQTALEDWEAFRRQLVEALELVWFLTIPAAAGLWAIRVPLVRLLFERGEFNRMSTLMTADALGYFALGLWAVAGSRVLVGAWYALDRAYVTVWIGVGALTINVLLSIFLVSSLGHSGLALAISVAAIANLLGLFILLGKHLGSIEARRLLLSGTRCLIAAIIMAAVIQALSWFTYAGGALQGGLLILGLVGWVLAGVLIYLGAALLLGVPEGVRRAWESRKQR
ncbi:MAG: murein biosynthesis integral membrane protein MurJ [Deltaproteobacteria bacterium]|nr:MAG: murein biosynthesis integral membrane protein MurJ [Deltaproteobacteria bacterium]